MAYRSASHIRAQNKMDETRFRYAAGTPPHKLLALLRIIRLHNNEKFFHQTAKVQWWADRIKTTLKDIASFQTWDKLILPQDSWNTKAVFDPWMNTVLYHRRTMEKVAASHKGMSVLDALIGHNAPGCDEKTYTELRNRILPVAQLLMAENQKYDLLKAWAEATKDPVTFTAAEYKKLLDHIKEATGYNDTPHEEAAVQHDAVLGNRDKIFYGYGRNHDHTPETKVWNMHEVFGHVAARMRLDIISNDVLDESIAQSVDHGLVRSRGFARYIAKVLEWPEEKADRIYLQLMKPHQDMIRTKLFGAEYYVATCVANDFIKWLMTGKKSELSPDRVQGKWREIFKNHFDRKPHENGKKSAGGPGLPEGPHQDMQIHTAQTLGRLLAYEMALPLAYLIDDKMNRELPDWEEKLANGDLKSIMRWREKIIRAADQDRHDEPLTKFIERIDGPKTASELSRVFEKRALLKITQAQQALEQYTARAAETVMPAAACQPARA